MPGSFRHFDALIADRIGLDFPERDIRVLDVGAGSGKFRDILHDYPHVDAVEVHEPYIERYQLRERYRQVFACDLREGPGTIATYDLVIFGDVIEHLTVEDAQAVLARTIDTAVLVTVPYLYEQGAHDGVTWEIHHQADLTHEVFMERYPGFDCLVRDEQYGVYVRNRDIQDGGHHRWSLDEVAERPYVLIATRTADFRCYTHLTVGLWETQRYHMQHGLAPLALMFQNGARAELSMNRIIAQFLDWPPDDPFGQPTHILSVDSDQGFKADALGRLLEHRAQVVGVPIRKKVQEVYWSLSGLPDSETTLWNGRLLEAGGIGFGFTLIARPALERLVLAHPELAMVGEGEQYHALCRTTDLSEDLEFCRSWRQLGGRVWADPTIEICHVGSTEFTGRMVDHMELQPQFVGAEETEKKERVA